MKKRIIKLDLRRLNNEALYTFAQGIHDGVQSRPVQFPSPTPSLPEFQLSINNVNDAVAKWGFRGNHGTTLDRTMLLQAREMLCENLKNYARYVMAVQPDNPVLWQDLGFALKNLPAKSGLTGPVLDLRQIFESNIPYGKLKLRWKRPFNTPPNTIITYIVLRSENNIAGNAEIVGTMVN